MVKRKYEKEYKEWLESKPTCQCGCGQPLTSDYHTFITSLMKYGVPTRFVKKYQSSMMRELREKKQPVKDKNVYVNFNGCNIRILLNEDKRCKDFKICPEYLKCLEFIVIGNKAKGWERIYPEKENI